ncbi:MAG: AlwI family type II restriction endonuclease [Bacteroidia bacterium]
MLKLINFKYSQQVYFNLFYNNTYPLPVDNSAFVIEEIKLLKETIANKENPLIAAVDNLTPEISLKNVQDLRHQLIEYNRWEREADFATEQQSQGAIANTLKYLKTLNDEVVEGKPEIEDRPAYLEWAVWRGFLAIDEIVGEVHKTRRFSIDQDFLPRNTAPGGGSDLIFEFETYVLVVEVTLTTSHRQMAVESEPVRRHTVQYKNLFSNKDVYCLFIAPEVDNNVAETFRIGVWYKGDNEEFINIVPMSLSDFIKTIAALQIRRYRNHDFRNLLDKCLISRNVRAPQWKNSISKEIDNWTQKVVNS